MLGLLRRHPVLRLVLVLLAIAVLSYAAIAWTLVIRHVPQERPWVEVVTTRCLDTDGIPVGEDFSAPCPSGTKVDWVEVQSYLPTVP